MRYRITLITICFILSCISISGANYQRFDYTNLESKPINTVVVRGYVCSDIDCKNPFLGNLCSGNIKRTDTEVPLNSIVLSIPIKSELPSNSNAMVLFSYNLAFLPKFKKMIPVTQSIYTDINNPYFPSTNILKLEKISSCSSPISLSVVNNIRENLPVSVTSGASMSSTTKSAFGFQSDVYNGFIRGSQFEQYYEVETTLRLRIFKYDIANTKT